MDYVDVLENSTNKMSDCPEENVTFYNTSLGIVIAVPQWEAIVTTVTLSAIIIFTIIGNILVILSVFTYKPLRIVQNFFIVSLAVADLTVALLVLPLNVAYSILGKWQFGIIMCKLWVTCDVMCCTASILNLCAIALDRYWAITDPINYAQKRTLRRVLWQILGVWFLSFIISSPPLFGWNNWPEDLSRGSPCQLNSRQGYVIYSSLGSFYIPLSIMAIVYIEIYIATRKRLRERRQASRIDVILWRRNHSVVSSNRCRVNDDRESVSSDNNSNDNNKLTVPKPKVNKYKVKTANQAQNVPLVGNDSTGDNNDIVAPNDEIVTTTTSVNNNNTTVYQFIEEKQKISLSKERKAARTLGIIMGVFVICWLPFFLMYVILPFCSTCCATRNFINVITWLGYINSTLNPIIYTIFNLDFRKAFRRLLGLNS